MKPIVIFARTQFELAMQMWSIRRAALDAIETTGAVRITIEPAPPSAIEAPPQTSRPLPGELVAAARSAR